jgi:hypothetical protein
VDTQIMTENDQPPRTPWGIIVLVAVVAFAAFQLGWATGRGRLDDEMQQIQKSKDWKLPENLAALGALSKQVVLQLEERRKFEQLNRDEPKQLARLGEMESRINELASQSKELAAKVAACEPESVRVPVGEARFVVPRFLAIGVSATDIYGNKATIQLGGMQRVLSPGESVAAEWGKTRYVVTLVKVSRAYCDFSFSKE